MERYMESVRLSWENIFGTLILELQKIQAICKEYYFTEEIIKALKRLSIFNESELQDLARRILLNKGHSSDEIEQAIQRQPFSVWKFADHHRRATPIEMSRCEQDLIRYVNRFGVLGRGRINATTTDNIPVLLGRSPKDFLESPRG
jgi:hypothetical protein